MAKVNELEQDFKRLVAENCLTHAYLCFGHESHEAQVGFAKSLAYFLEHKQWQLDGKVLLDALTLDGQNNGGIDLVRMASNFLWQKPVASPRRTLIIDKADYLTLPAQNAILKIAEEPPAHALIILLVRHPEVLLPAVQSRFQKIYVHGRVNENLKMKNEKPAEKFLEMNSLQRKEFIKDLIEQEKENSGVLEEFMTDLIAELKKDPIKNYQTLKFYSIRRINPLIRSDGLIRRSDPTD